MKKDIIKSELLLDIITKFGVHTPMQAGVAEVFGLYHMSERGPTYLRYAQVPNNWSVDMGLESPLPDNRWGDFNLAELRERIKGLAFLRPPAMPANSAIHHAEPSFIYGGWLFAWIYSPVIARWSLAPLAKL